MKNIEKVAFEYAKETVQDWQNHLDAVNCVKDDFMAGYQYAHDEVDAMENELPYDVEKSINYVIDNFDFEKVHKVMTALNWEWDGVGIPSVDELKFVAKDRLESSYNGLITFELDEFNSVGGGFIATCCYGADDIDRHYFELSFVIESSDNFDGDEC